MENIRCVFPEITPLMLFNFKRMKKTILFLSITFMFMCCTSKSEGSIVLFNDIAFKLIDGEEVMSIDSKKKELFDSYFDEKSIQIPLFRCIKADEYLIFLGIPFNTSVKELSDYHLKHTVNQSLFESDSTNYFYMNYRKGNDNIAVLSKDFDNNLIYILTVSNSVELSDALFSKNSLSERFNK